jgi:hypothetical protein
LGISKPKDAGGRGDGDAEWSLEGLEWGGGVETQHGPYFLTRNWHPDAILALPPVGVAKI